MTDLKDLSVALLFPLHRNAAFARFVAFVYNDKRNQRLSCDSLKLLQSGIKNGTRIKWMNEGISSARNFRNINNCRVGKWKPIVSIGKAGSSIMPRKVKREDLLWSEFSMRTIYQICKTQFDREGYSFHSRGARRVNGGMGFRDFIARGKCSEGN